MKNEIIINVEEKDLIKVALFEDGELVELHVEDMNNEELVGKIFLGKVLNIFPGMQAAFIDIGKGKNAYLPFDDIVFEKDFMDSDKLICDASSNNYVIGGVIKRGENITVQVGKEACGTKGPRVTTNIALVGKYVVLLPRANCIGVSKKITSIDDRNRLRVIAEEIKPVGMGMIIRTASKEESKEHFVNDMNFLLKRWEDVVLQEQKALSPKCIYNDLDVIDKVVRDMFTPRIDKLIINNREKCNKLLDLLDVMSPSLKSRVECIKDEVDLFELYKVHGQIHNALAKKVWLECGGYIVIERTEALTVIDVNTGKHVGTKNLEDTVLKTNIQAAREIAKQLRLRDIGGIIIIDFIDMEEEEHGSLVMELLKQEVKKDRIKTTVVGMTTLGLVEMTRKKIGRTLQESWK